MKARPTAARCLAAAAAIGLTAIFVSTGSANAADTPTPGTRPATASARALAAPAAPGGLGVVASQYGHLSRSVVAVASNDSSGTDAVVTKPAGATVRAAYLAFATTGFSGQELTSAPTIDDKPVSLDHETASGISSYNYFADVTTTVKPKVDAAAAGKVTLRVAEPQPDITEGEILTVVFDDPAVTVNQTVSVLFGALSPTGDSYQVQLSSPIKVDDPQTKLEMSLGISFSYQENGTPQYSTVKVNGNLVTSSAGGSDDGTPNNGALITVGGDGDDVANPADPAAAPANARTDDELYDLRPFVHNGDSSIRVDTNNPSLDDNVFFALFAMNPPATTIATGGSVYVAMGDSYQSGEGAHSYVDGTDVSGNRCHRSSVSYPYLIKGGTGVPADLKDVACSGAEIHNLTDGQNGEPAQYDALNERTALVTIGIGGNDLNFASTIKDCVLGPQLSGDFFSLTQTCHQRFDKTVESTLAKMDTAGADGLTEFSRVYDTIRAKAPHARIVVVGYPHFFKPSGNLLGCKLVYRSDEKWIDQKIDEVDAVIQRNAEGMGAEYAGGANEFDGHELCGDGDEFMNGIVGTGDSESFHPNVAGHRRLADLLGDHIKTFQPENTFTIGQGQTINFDVLVSSLRALVSFLSSWPGSQVTMTVTDPNGRVINASTSAADILHRAGPTSELFRVTKPIAGTWHVSLYGKDVAAGGEPVTVSVAQPPKANKIPVAAATARANTAGTTVTYSAKGSHDPDGSIKSYEWDFGDGTIGTGLSVTHRYTNLGHLDQPTLIVTDNQGAEGFAALPAVKVHYGFTGLLALTPCSGYRPAVAGKPLVFAWRLTDPAGHPVTDAEAVTSYGFDNPGGQYKLVVDRHTGQYLVTATTPKTWRHTVQTFTVKLDDNSVHTMKIRFS